MHPRGARLRAFTNSDRAVVREAEWKDILKMGQRVANELKPLIKLANDQGWKIDSSPDGTKLVWRGPRGEGPVYTGYRCQGRDLLNYRAELVRAGLKLDEDTAKQHVAETTAAELFEKTENVSLEDIKNAMDIINGGMAFLIVKAESFDKIRSDCKDWESIASDAQDAAEAAIKQRDELQTLVDSIRATFGLQPWAILPEIARLLGIDAANPMKQSLADQATNSRRTA